MTIQNLAFPTLRSTGEATELRPTLSVSRLIFLVFALGRQSCLPAVLGRTHAVHASPHAASALITVITATAVAFCFLFGIDPLLGLGAVGIGLGTVRIIAHQALTSLAVVAYFHRWSRSHWSTAIMAPLTSFIGLALAVSLAVRNFDLLSGSQNQLVILRTYSLIAAVLVGGVYAAWLQRKRPTIFFRRSRSRLRRLKHR